MDSAAAKSFELQASIRNNAEVYRSTIGGLYSWEKEIKLKDKSLMEMQPTYQEQHALKTLPIRSHVQEQPPRTPKPSAASTAQTTKENKGKQNEENKTKEQPTVLAEKQDTPLDPALQLIKEAEEFKDRGNAFVKTTDYKNAILEYTKAIELHSKEQIYFCNRALCYLKLEMYEECIEDCSQAIQLDKLSKKAYYRRMQAHESLGNQMDALKDCTTILSIDPKSLEAKRSLERINERLSKNTKNAMGPSFSQVRSNMIDVVPYEKPACKRSSKPLNRINVNEIVSKVTSNEPLKISDEEMEKLFNSNVGPYVEVKKGTKPNEKLETTSEKPNQTPATKPAGTTTVKKAVDVKKEEDTRTEKQRNTQVVNKKGNNEVPPPSAPAQERPLPPTPTSSAQFYACWKELSPEQKYLYFKSIDKGLERILGAGFDSRTLTDILQVLHNFYVPNKLSCLKPLVVMGNIPQMKILSMFLSDQDKQLLTGILDAVAKDECAETIRTISKLYNLSYEPKK